MLKKTMNQMTLLAALRRSESLFPVSNAEQKIRNSIWRMITFFLGVRPERINGVISDARKVKEYQAFLHLRCQPDATA